MLAHMLGSVSACDRHYRVECRWLTKQKRKGDDKPCVQTAPGAGGRFHGNEAVCWLPERSGLASVPAVVVVLVLAFRPHLEGCLMIALPVSSLPHPSASLPLASP